MNASIPSGCSFGPQSMVDQTPRFDRVRKRRRKAGYQVIGKSGIIRPDKRKKGHYL